MLFPTKSNSQKGEFNLDFFKAERLKEEKPDLLYKQGKFTLNNKFLQDRTEFTGFATTLSEDYSKGYLVRSTDKDSFDKTLFVKGEKAVNTFSSDALEFVIKHIGVDLEKQIFLNEVESTKAGFITYEISNLSKPTLVSVEDGFQGDIAAISDSLRIDPSGSDNDIDSSQEIINSIPVSQVATEPIIANIQSPEAVNEVEALAQIGVEEQKEPENLEFDTTPLETLL